MASIQTWQGRALALGGLLAIAVNGVLTPMMPTDKPFGEVAASSVFLVRLSLATMLLFLLIVGSLGLFSRHRAQISWFGSLAFGLTFLGCLITFAHEWSQVFFVHPLGIVAPEALEALENVEGQNLFDIETMAALSAFMLGWLLFAISMAIAGTLPRTGPLLVIVGLIASPALSAVLTPVTGMAIGAVVLALGWFWLGRDLARSGNG